MTNPKVSIIMPLYNNKDYVERAIRSVIDQTYDDWELIIINDKSTDNIEPILLKYKDNNKIRILHNKKNSGCYRSLNRGLLVSKGEYIARLDSDDYMDIHKIEEQVKHLDNNPRCEMIFCQCKSDGHIVSRSMGTVMMRRDVIDKIGYYDSVRVAADSEYKDRYYKINGTKNIYVIRKILYHITNRPNSLSRNTQTGMKSMVRNTYKRSYKDWHKNNNDLFIEFPLKKRKFHTPKEII